MKSRAHVEFDPMTMGVRIAVQRPDLRQFLTWQRPGVEPITERDTEAPAEAWLPIQEDDARAIYEALADYFGHTGHDIRALRKDYDSERGRVDRLIGHLIGPGR